ncbi:MAG: DUF4143 domain-containing protein [Lachnospiraceae bacterium]|nr:DUF4143 domain-containing protein [Lachnospiraceae bacterium]
MTKYLSELLQEVPAISLDGLKGVGKTVTADTLSATRYDLDRELDHTLLANNIERLSLDAPPILIDEWQKHPPVWDYVRRAVDKGCAPGSFLMTGSVSCADIDIHSGSGRILRIRMYPLSLAERGLAAPSVSMGALLDAGPFACPLRGETALTSDDYIREILASGLPGIRRYSARIRKKLLDTYIENLLSHEFLQQGIRIRQPLTLLRWLRAYAAAIATDAGYAEILDASTAGEGDKPSTKTTIAYRKALGNLWLIDELPTWSEGEDYYARLKRTPKHYLADPALTAQLLHFDESDLLKAGSRIDTRFDLRHGNIIGRLFESLAQLSLRTYSTVNDADLSWLRTANGDHEVDFILQRGCRLVAFEVKFAPTVRDEDAKHLHWFRHLVGDRLTDAIILTTGPLAYRRPDGIGVVPLALLGA